jgi:polyphosphate kinase 2 (PPK2 family)
LRVAGATPRVHKLVPESVWSKRYDQINDFETMLTQNDTTILKFFLHISPEEQLLRFKQRLDDPSRHWKISESDYSGAVPRPMSPFLPLDRLQ